MRRNFVTISVISAISMLLSGSSAAAQDMIGVSWSGNVYSIDSTTGTSVQIGSTGLGSGANSMTIGPLGEVYCFQRVGPAGNYQSQLVVLDPLTGMATAINAPFSVDVRGAAYDAATGLIFLINDNATSGTGSDALVTYSVATQTVTSIGSTGDTNLQSLAITPDGKIYTYVMLGANQDRLAVLDRNTGAMTIISQAPQTTQSTIQFLTAKDNNTLYAGRDDLHSIDTTTGVMSLLFSGIGADLRGCDYLTPLCYQTYGAGCPGSGGFTPELGLTNCPVAGAGISINISKALGGANAVLFFGTMQSALPMGGGCFLNVQPLLPLTIPLTLGGFGAGNGATSVVGVVPAIASGLTLTAQVFVADPGGGFAGFTASGGLEMPFQ